MSAIQSNPDGNLLLPPDPSDHIALAPDFGTRFMLFVDTEEEFDWNADFDRRATQVSALKGLAEGQAYFRAAGMTPVYVVDYPILESAGAMDLLRGWSGAGEADVGAHLHPWVNPPHVEAVCLANSYVGNQPEAQERAKLLALRDRITQEVGRAPIAYRAGRYGIGPNSHRLLEEAGFRLDSSVRSRFDYRRQLGPDFTGLPLVPYRVGPNRSLVELPLSTAFTGHLRGLGDRLYAAAEGSGRLPGALSRLGLLTRVPLTPEGVPVEEAIAAIDALIEAGVPVLNLSFHSPTLEPGHTPYVRDAGDLKRFYAWWDGVLGHMAKRGVAPASLGEFMAAVPPLARNACKAA